MERVAAFAWNHWPDVVEYALDPENDKVTLAALSQAAKAVGRTLRLELQ